MGVDQSLIAAIKKMDIDPARKLLLEELKAYCITLIEQKGKANILFVCRHNSRRSQFYQVWSQYWALQFKLPVNTFSGGLEESGIYPKTLRALRSQGFHIKPKLTGYELLLSATEKFPLFSKPYNHKSNPHTHYVWVNTCAETEDCEWIVEPKLKVSLPFEDPVVGEDLNDDLIRFEKASQIIAVEMFLLMTLIQEEIKSTSENQVEKKMV